MALETSSTSVTPYFDMKLYIDDNFDTEISNLNFAVGDPIHFKIFTTMPSIGLSYQVTNCGLYQNTKSYDFVDQVRMNYRKILIKASVHKSMT